MKNITKYYYYHKNLPLTSTQIHCKSLLYKYKTHDESLHQL
jgi:hypothetical protein